MRILVVDDHLLIQQSLAHLLNSQPGFKVVGGARSVKEAVKQAWQHKPDCILMDFSLPDGTGLKATRAILAKQPTIKIVFLTMHEDEKDLFNAIQQGAQGYLPKHITSAQLLHYMQALKQGEYAIEPKFTKRIIDEFAKSPKPEVTYPRHSQQSLFRRTDTQTVPSWCIPTLRGGAGDLIRPHCLGRRTNGHRRSAGDEAK